MTKSTNVCRTEPNATRASFVAFYAIRTGQEKDHVFSIARKADTTVQHCWQSVVFVRLYVCHTASK